MTNQKLLGFGLENKIIVISGSSRGIGKEIAHAFAKQGGRVYINGKNSESVKKTNEEFAKEGLVVYGFAADVTDQTHVRAFSDFVLQREKRIDILINNAGTSKWKTANEISLSVWEEELKNNLTSGFLLTQAFLPTFQQQKSGKIIFISSTSSLKMRNGGSHYIASKSAVNGFAKALAKELGSFGITANIIAPGLIDTDLTRMNYSDEIFSQMTKDTPIGRLANPADIANAALFLASPLADAITGHILVVDGGASI